MSIDVFYIAYLKKDSGWGVKAFEKFLNSYEKFPAGIEHSLTILLRGYENNSDDYNKIKSICNEKNIKTLDTQDVGLDFGAYLDGAKQSQAEYICCLNTTCEIMCDDWLKKLYSPVTQDEKYKIIGFRGSWEPCPTYARDFRSHHREHYKSYLRYIMALLNTVLQRLNLFRIMYHLIFPKKIKTFPNYRVETAGFLIFRTLLTEYFEQYQLPVTKLDSHKVESGQNSLSNFALKKGYDFCIVNKYGIKFDKEDFNKSGTFRSNEKNYIIKDRQQEMYESADFFSKIYLRRICWGK